MASPRRTTGTAFVLAGGGSLGAVQVGMLRSLTAAGVVPDLLVGASAGAINASFFAGDPTARGVAELERIWRGLERSDVLPVSLLQGGLGVLGFRRHLVDPGPLRRLLARTLPAVDLARTALAASWCCRPATPARSSFHRRARSGWRSTPCRC